jgi:adenylate kinase family enzyme/tetratricopeptide (TPR) repeat protein
MSEEKRILLAALREFLEDKLIDPMLAMGDIPPGLQEVVFHRAEQMGRLDDLRPPYCEEIVRLVLDELCQRRFRDLSRKLGSTRKRGGAFTSLLLVRTQHLAPLLDGVDILDGRDTIECLQNPECLQKVRPKNIPSPLLENVEDRIAGLMDARGQQSGAVSRHRREGLRMLADEIWRAYEAMIPAVLGVPEPPAPEMPPSTPDHWRSQFAKRLQSVRQVAPSLEPPPPAQSEPLVPAAGPEGLPAQEGSSTQEEPLIGEVVLVQEEPPIRQRENADEGLASRLRERFPLPPVAPLVPRTELLHRLRDLRLGEGGPPLIGLWGTAGVGKTALLQMLWQDPEVQRQFDYPLWSELGFDADASLDAARAKQHLREQLSSWADGLSLPVADLSTVDQLSTAIQTHLQNRRVLIMLDDAWSGDSIPPFLAGSKAVVTTRNRALLDGLRVDCEMVEIPPMTLGEAQVMVRQGTGQGIEYNDPRLYELHQRTDGLPQALKLALSRLPELGWEQVLGFLREETSRLSLLEQGEGRSRAESIRASFALSYERLRPEQQRLFRVLGVFAPAPLSPQTVQAVYQQGSVEATELELRRLADLSLVQSHPVGDGTSLLQMSGLSRDYARELLREQGELERFEERCIADQVRRAEALSDRFQTAGADMAQVMEAFHRELSHFDYVYRLSFQHEDDERIHRLLTSCPILLIHTGWIEIWQEWLVLLEPWLGQEALGTRKHRALLVEWNLQRAELLLEQGDAQETVEILKRIGRPRDGDPAQEARWLLTLTSASMQLGQARKARRYLDQAQKIGLARQDLGLRFWMQSLQAQLSRTERVPRRIVQAHAMAISTCRTAGNRAGELAERLNLAESYRQFGWVEKALNQLRHVADQAGRLELPALYLTSLKQLADLYLDAGQVRKAAEVVDWLRPFSGAEVLGQFEDRLHDTPDLRRNPNIGLRPELARRIVIVGPPGSGKTALAQQLAQQLGWPHVELDALCWSSASKPVSAVAFREHTLQALRGETWIVDGNHWEVRDIVWGRADLLVWLNYSPWQAVGQRMKRLRQEIGHRDEAEEEQPGTPATVCRDSVIVKGAQTFRRRQEEYPVSLSLRDMEQLIPKIVHLDSPQGAQLWLSEFAEAQQHQAMVERL